MLILTRRVDESMKLSEEMLVTVLDIQRNQVRMVIDEAKLPSNQSEEISS